MQAELEIHEYTPMQIKQSVTGYGKADKKQMQEMVRVLLKLKEVPKPDDAADALAAALTHSNAVRH
jgi:crossover junction endodeoxyribonuclease RuvC